MESVLLSSDDDISEIKQLASTLGYSVTKTFIQYRSRKTPLYFGEGKLEELKKYILNNNPDLIIVNDELRPSQWFNLEKQLGVTVYDRIRLILEVFSDRAHRKEAKLQVSLAKLRYNRPFVRELFSKIKEGERPGFLGGGEYVVADYYEMIKKQSKKIKAELQKISMQRDIRRKERKKHGFYLVSFAGYTNAGKSMLLNRVTGETVLVEDKLFSTLSTKTSVLQAKKYPPILCSDTVGFIKKLPHWLIDAFQATLEEIYLADVIVLLIDGTDCIEEIIEKTRVCLSELKRLKDDLKIVIAFNKIDLICNSYEKKLDKIKKITGLAVIPISAKTGKNLEELIEQIYKSIPQICHIKIEVPHQEADGLIKWLSERDMIVNIAAEKTLILDVACNKRLQETVIGKSKKIGGLVTIYGDN